jgi:hypothetical protein
MIFISSAMGRNVGYVVVLGPFLVRRDGGDRDEKRQGVVMDNLACRYQINANF